MDGAPKRHRPGPSLAPLDTQKIVGHSKGSAMLGRVHIDPSWGVRGVLGSWARLALVAAVWATGCASTLDGGAATVDASTAPVDASTVDQLALALAYEDAGWSYDTYAADVCPLGRPPPLRQYRCDPFAARACARGYSCRPFIDPPTVACGSETYRAECFLDGRVALGGACRLGTDCEAGTSCFSTAATNRCLRLCRLDGADPTCPRGSVCEPTDLPNIGACL